MGAATFARCNYAWLRGAVQVVGLTSKCGESSSAGTQLQVVKALLTYVTGGWLGGCACGE